MLRYINTSTRKYQHHINLYLISYLVLLRCCFVFNVASSECWRKGIHYVGYNLRNTLLHNIPSMYKTKTKKLSSQTRCKYMHARYIHIDVDYCVTICRPMQWHNIILRHYAVEYRFLYFVFFISVVLCYSVNFVPCILCNSIHCR